MLLGDGPSRSERQSIPDPVGFRAIIDIHVAPRVRDSAGGDFAVEIHACRRIRNRF